MLKTQIASRSSVSSVLSALAMSIGTIGASGCGGAQATPSQEVAQQLPAEQADTLREIPGRTTDATQHYGALTVLPTSPEGEEATANYRPWASHWYPLADDIMINPSERNGGQPLLEKFDKYVLNTTGRASQSQKLERENRNLYDPEAGGSDGRCNAWAIASVLEDEPVLPREGVVVDGVKFHTRDVKALMIKSYETIDQSAVIRFGSPYRSYMDDASDIYPDQFHRVIQAEIFEKHRPIIMDRDPSEAFWNTPVFWAETKIEADAADPHLFHVRTTLLGAKAEDVSADYPDVRVISTSLTKFYTYDLYGIPQADGSLLVKYGEWTGDSKADHPDYMFAVPEKGAKIKHSSMNKDVDNATVEEILAKTGALRRNP